MQAALQLNPSLSSATALFQSEYFGLIMWAFFHLNLVTQELFSTSSLLKVFSFEQGQRRNKEEVTFQVI